MTTSRAQKALVSGCIHCDVVNQTLQIRHIGYRSAVALSSPIVQITADVLLSDVRHQYCSDTTNWCLIHNSTYLTLTLTQTIMLTLLTLTVIVSGNPNPTNPTTK